MASIRLAYYGDDFTGSSDALESLAVAGLKPILFLKPPTHEQLAAYPGIDAVGVAGATRSMVTADLESRLREDFLSLRKLDAAHVHYKVCSTFDSSPQIGSIGRAIEVGCDVFKKGPAVPLIVAAPTLGRYCVFGNLFARFGTGAEGEIHRLDRHPAMQAHPVTPADESDLGLHLAKQTDLPIQLFDILQYENDGESNWRHLTSLFVGVRDKDRPVVLFDALNNEHLCSAGWLMDRCASGRDAVFCWLVRCWRCVGAKLETTTDP